MSEGRGDAEPSGPGSAEANPSPVVFRVQPGFQFFYSLPVLLALAILVDALLAPAADKWLFLALVLAMSLISVPRGWSKVTLDDAQVTLITPLRRPRPVSLHRLAAFEPSQRLGRALLLRYYPDDAAGQPDPANEAVLGLPPLQDQFLLEEQLQAALDRQAPA